MVTPGVPVHPFRVWHALRTHHPKPPPCPPTIHPPIERTITYNENTLRGGIFARDFSRRLRLFKKGILRERDFVRDFMRRIWLFLYVRYDLLTDLKNESIDWFSKSVESKSMDSSHAIDRISSRKKIDIPKFFIFLLDRYLFIISRMCVRANKSLEYSKILYFSSIAIFIISRTCVRAHKSLEYSKIIYFSSIAIYYITYVRVRAQISRICIFGVVRTSHRQV